MPDLSDFLGTIIQETARARMLSDLESVRIAEAYYQDVYLKHLPIPHFKMPEIVIQMPVEVKQINPPGSNVTNSTMMSKMRQRINDDLQRYLNAAFRAILAEPSTKENLNPRTLPTRRITTLKTMRDALGKRIKTSCDHITGTIFHTKDYIDVNTVPIRLTELADNLENMLYKELTENYKEFFKIGAQKGKTLASAKDNLDTEAIQNMLKAVRQLFMDSVTFIMKENETTLEIEGSTGKLAQAGNASLLTMLKITIREQDYEWSIEEREDGVGIEKRSLTIE